MAEAPGSTLALKDLADGKPLVVMLDRLKYAGAEYHRGDLLTPGGRFDVQLCKAGHLASVAYVEQTQALAMQRRAEREAGDARQRAAAQHANDAAQQAAAERLAAARARVEELTAGVEQARADGQRAHAAHQAKRAALPRNAPHADRVELGKLRSAVEAAADTEKRLRAELAQAQKDLEALTAPPAGGFVVTPRVAL